MNISTLTIKRIVIRSRIMNIFEYLKQYFEKVEAAYRESKLSDPFAMKDILEQAGYDLGDYDKSVHEKIETYFMQKDINEIMKS
jgi:hypothetical protein